jgi:hypothetical protein
MIRQELITDDSSTSESVSEISQFNRQEIDMQIATAHRFPRSITTFRKEVAEMACLDEETAGSMFYVLPRGGKKIEGPSARFAEVVGAAYGNLRYGARIAGIEGNFVVAEGVCFDVQKNIAATVHVRRRITDREGNRFNDDMIQVTGNAACSIALRNAIFKVVPMGLVKDIYEEAKLTSIGKSKSMAEKRQAAVAWFAKVGVSQEKVLETIGKRGLDDITDDDLIELRGITNAIKEGDTTIEELLGRVASKRGIKRSSIDDVLGEEPQPAAPKSNGKAKPVTQPQPEPKPNAETGGEEFERSQRVRGQYIEQLNSTFKLGALKSLLKDATEDELLSDVDRMVVVTEIEDRIRVTESAGS